MTDEKVASLIEFRERKREPELVAGTQILESERGQRCMHYSPCQIVLSEAKREIRCSRCNALLDQFDVLLSFAYQERHLLVDAKSLINQRKYLEGLAAEEDRIKARLKNARQRLTEVAPDDPDAHTAESTTYHKRTNRGEEPIERMYQYETSAGEAGDRALKRAQEEKDA